ncbi:MAG TPA: ERF family protein [Methanosarcina sp.]|nr:ERF family protein [Methanosarcina sp.]
MSVHKKLNQSRIKLQNTKLKKSGHNKFAGYDYFELGDFLPDVQKIFNEIGLCGVISFASDLATLTITDVDDNSQIVITSPMAEANLKGCHPIQNLGAVETYTRRYLWVTALEIVEYDALDATTGSGKITPTSGLWDALELDQQTFLQDIANEAISLINKGDVKGAIQHINDQKLDNDEKAALATRFDSKQRSAMVKTRKEME